MRETFKKKLAEIPVKYSGDGAEDDDDDKPDWQYFDSLLFLKDQCLPRKSTGNFEESNTEALEETEDIEDESELNSIDDVISEIESQPTTPASSSSTQQNIIVHPTIKKAKTQRITRTADSVGEALLKVEEEKVAYLKRKEQNRNKRDETELDEDEAFFKSILPHVRAMHPRQKFRFRIKVLEFLEKEISTPSTVQSVSDERVATTRFSGSSPRGSILPNTNLQGYDIVASRQDEERFPITRFNDSHQRGNIPPNTQPKGYGISGTSGSRQDEQVFRSQINFHSASDLINQGGGDQPNYHFTGLD